MQAVVFRAKQHSLRRIPATGLIILRVEEQKMMDIGRVCKKIAGRDAGLLCVIVEIDKKGRALVDGETRRKAVNMRHLMPLEQTLDIAKGADHAAVASAFKKIDVEVRETKAKKADAKPGKAAKTAEKTEDTVEATADKAAKPQKEGKAAEKKAAKEKKEKK